MSFEDSSLTPYEKQFILLSNLYRKTPPNIKEALIQGMRFLNGSLEETDGGEYHPKVYSFIKDANLIFAAFRQTHGIDLESADMHWWKFMALFMDLGSETAFCNLVSLRSRVKTGKATKEERKMASDMGSMFEVPEVDTRTLDEKIAEANFMAELGRQA